MVVRILMQCCGIGFYKANIAYLLHIMRNDRRIGEAIIIASGVGLTIGGQLLGIAYLVYGGLAIAGLGIISALWR
jgi:hypothetical protein